MGRDRREDHRGDEMQGDGGRQLPARGSAKKVDAAGFSKGAGLNGAGPIEGKADWG